MSKNIGWWIIELTCWEYTHLEISMSPEKGPLKKDMNHLPTIIFPGDIVLGGGFKYFLCSPWSLGKMNPFWLLAYFVDGRFNHQGEVSFRWQIFISTPKLCSNQRPPKKHDVWYVGPLKNPYLSSVPKDVTTWLFLCFTSLKRSQILTQTT